MSKEEQARQQGEVNEGPGQGRREDRPQEEQGAGEAPLPASFTGDMRGGGPGAGADLGRGGTSTPVGDIAGGGQPGTLTDIGEGTASVGDAVPTGGAGDLARAERVEPRRETLREQPVDVPRTALDRAPGIPAGSGNQLDRSLQTPDSELGGAVAADTTPGGRTGDEPDARKIAEEDRDRNTL